MNKKKLLQRKYRLKSKGKKVFNGNGSSVAISSSGKVSLYGFSRLAPILFLNFLKKL